MARGQVFVYRHRQVECAFQTDFDVTDAQTALTCQMNSIALTLVQLVTWLALPVL